MFLPRIISLSVFRIFVRIFAGLLGTVMLIPTLYANTSASYQVTQDKCPIIIDKKLAVSRSFSCHLRTTNTGSVISWVIAKNRHVTLFASLANAGPKLLFPHSDGTKDSTIFHLGHFGYSCTADNPAYTEHRAK